MSCRTSWAALPSQPCGIRCRQRTVGTGTSLLKQDPRTGQQRSGNVRLGGGVNFALAGIGRGRRLLAEGLGRHGRLQC